MDYGEKRIGVAVSDPLQMFARPLKVLPGGQEFFAEFANILAEYTPQKIILGMPYDLEGKKTKKCAEVEVFSSLLLSYFDLPVECYDEAFSSVDARKKLARKGVSYSQIKGKLDMYAAAEILGNYLERGK